MYVGVNNLRNVTVTTTVIKVMWNHAVSPSDCGPVLYYNVTAVNLADPRDMRTLTLNGREATFSNLEKDTFYDISVTAVNRAGTGPSSTITVTTDKSKIIMFNVHNSTNMCINGTAPKQHCKHSKHLHHSLSCYVLALVN